MTTPAVVYDAKRDYSAVGDGVHDDTVNIQNCINAAVAYGQHHGAGSCIAYLPLGRYKITATLVLPVNSANFIFGAVATEPRSFGVARPAAPWYRCRAVSSNLVLENMRVGSQRRKARRIMRSISTKFGLPRTATRE